MSEPPDDLSRAWVAIAQDDIDAAEILLPNLPGAAAFHVQQAIEKALKAMMVARGEPPLKSHDLVRLMSLVETDLTWSAPPAWLGEITDWNAVSRYPSIDTLKPEFDADVVATALDRARDLLAEITAFKP